MCTPVLIRYLSPPACGAPGIETSAAPDPRGTFRALLPALLVNNLGVIVAVVLSNLIFASVHYITLRWKFSNCVGVFIGGLALSRLLHNSEDIVLVILVHWWVTFLNTHLAPKVDKVETNYADG